MNVSYRDPVNCKPLYCLRDASSEEILRWKNLSPFISAIDMLSRDHPGWVSKDLDLALRAVYVLGRDEKSPFQQEVAKAALAAAVLSGESVVSIIERCFYDTNLVPLFGLLESGFDINTPVLGRTLLERAIDAEKKDLVVQLLQKGARFRSQDKGRVAQARGLVFDYMNALPNIEVSLKFLDLALRQGLPVDSVEGTGSFLLTDAFSQCPERLDVWEKILSATDFQADDSDSEGLADLLRTFFMRVPDTNENQLFLEKLLEKMPRGKVPWKIFEDRLSCTEEEKVIAHRVAEWIKRCNSNEGRKQSVRAALAAGLLSEMGVFYLIEQCLDMVNWEPLFELIESGFDINTPIEGVTVLERAIAFGKNGLAEKLLQKGARFRSQDEGRVAQARGFFFFHLNDLSETGPLDDPSDMDSSKGNALEFVDLALRQGLPVNSVEGGGSYFLTRVLSKYPTRPEIWEKILNATDFQAVESYPQYLVELLHSFVSTVADTEENRVFLQKLLEKIPPGVPSWENKDGMLPCTSGDGDIDRQMSEWLKSYYSDDERKLGMLLSLGESHDEALQLIEKFQTEGRWSQVFFDLFKETNRGLGIVSILWENQEVYKTSLYGIVGTDWTAMFNLDKEVQWSLVPFMTPDELKKFVSKEKIDPDLQQGLSLDPDVVELYNTYDDLWVPEEMVTYEEAFQALPLQSVAQGMMNGYSDMFYTVFGVLNEHQQRIVLVGLETQDASSLLFMDWLDRLSLSLVASAPEPVKKDFFQKLFSEGMAINRELLEDQTLCRLSCLLIRQDRPYTRKLEGDFEAFLQKYPLVAQEKIILNRLENLFEDEIKVSSPSPVLKDLMKQTQELLKKCQEWEETKVIIDNRKNSPPASEENVCPISGEKIRTPARIKADVDAGEKVAWVYDRNSLMQWLDQNDGKAPSPQTRRSFTEDDIVGTARKKRRM